MILEFRQICHSFNYMYTHARMYVCIMYVCMYVCIFVCMYVSMYVCMYLCMYVSMYVSMYMYYTCKAYLHSI